MSANMKDVAQRCGVSIKTVSNVINRLPNVGEKTRKAVLEAIRELNYVPNIQARSLVMKQPGAKSQLGYRIGCIFPNGTGKYDDTYFTMIFKGIEEEIANQGQQLSFLSSATELEENPLKMNWLLAPEQTDAVLSFVGPDSPLFERFSQMPFILIGGESKDCETVCIDKSGGAAELLRHLYDLGHRDIAYIGPLNDGRCRAFRFEAMQRGLSLRDDCMIESGCWGMEPGRTGAKRLLALEQRPTAVFAASDRLAFGVMHELQDAGLRIPRDISVAGYDNLPESRIVYPALTTVDINKEGTGRLAVRLLLDRIRNPQRENATHTLPTRLVIRTSTGKVVKS